MTPESRFIGKQELPWTPGQHDGATVYWRDVQPGAEAARSATLTDLAATHVFFHAGLVPAVTGRDVVPLYWAEAGIKDRPVLFALGVRLFQGEGLPSPWDRVVFGCPASVWLGLCRHLDRLAFQVAHGPSRVTWTTTRTLIPTLDPVTTRRLCVGRPAPATPAVVPVHMIGLISAVGEYCWEAPSNLWTSPVKLTFRPVNPPVNPR